MGSVLQGLIIEQLCYSRRSCTTALQTHCIGPNTRQVSYTERLGHPRGAGSVQRVSFSVVGVVDGPKRLDKTIAARLWQTL